MTSVELFTREEALGGLLARRARVLLFLIESRTARRAARAGEIPTLTLAPELGILRPALLSEVLLSDGTDVEDESLLAPFGQSRDRLPNPDVREIERYAPDWAPLVPENPRLRAAVAHLLGEKYRFTSRAVPGIRTALGLDDAAVQAAYEGIYDEPLASIYAPQVPATERLRWAQAALGKRLDALPPFWFALIYILALGIPQSMLALPIAVASVGALPGVGLILLGGLLSLVTVIGIAEAVARNGTVRYGSAYFGRLVAEYLGRAGAVSLMPFAMAFFALTVLAGLIGIATTLAHFTPIPAAVWAAIAFAGGLYLLARGIRSVSLGSSLILAVLILALIGLVMLLSLPRFRFAHLWHGAAPAPGGHPPGLESVVGVVLMGYFIEMFVVQCAKAVLPRDPSGRSLIWASVAGLGIVAALLCVWVLLVNGVVPPEALAGQRSAVFVPLAAIAGPSIALLGSILVVLLSGLAVMRCMIGGFALVREWLPTPPRTVTFLPRESGRLVLRSRRGRGDRPHGGCAPAIGFTFTEFDGNAPQFRLDIQSTADVCQMETTMAGRWDVSSLFAKFPELRLAGLRFSLEVVGADEEGVRLLVDTAPGVTCETEQDPRGLRLADLASLSDDDWHVLSWLLRRGPEGGSPEEVAAGVGQPGEVDRSTPGVGGNPLRGGAGDDRSSRPADYPAGTHLPVEAARATLEALAKKGLVRNTGSDDRPCYRAHFAPRRARRLPSGLWQALEEDPLPASRRGRRLESPSSHPSLFTRRPWAGLLAQRGSFALSVSPLVAIFLVTEWLLLSGKGSFTGALGYLGVISNVYATGIVPLLLLLSCRRKGEVQPGTVLRFAGHPLLLGSLYLLYLAILLVHGLVLWQEPWARAAVLLAAAAILGATVRMVRQGAFTPRAIVELREDLSRGNGVFSVMAAGEPLMAAAHLEYPNGRQESHAATGEVPEFSSLRSATFDLTGSPARELKVWAHRVTPDGESQPLPAVAEIYCRGEIRRVDLGLSRGQVLLPLPPGACQVHILL